MKPTDLMTMALNPAAIFKALGRRPDPWQHNILTGRHRNTLLNCSRQAGKSTTVSALALHQALFTPNSLVLVLAPSQRQSGELFTKIEEAYDALGRPVAAPYHTQLRMGFANKSRIICLPGDEGTIRGYSNVSLLIIDEATRVPDDLYRSVTPMLAVSGGRMYAMATPWGRRGWFYKEWADPQSTWHKVHVTWRDCPRITALFIEEERRRHGDAWVAQEYEGQFSALEGLVYPNFHETFTDFYTLPATGKLVGGIDFGYRNPFAAIWGVYDRDGVLHIQEERYLRETTISEHIEHLPKKCTWYADPAAAAEIQALRQAGFHVLRGYNEIRIGIAAVQARIRQKTLTVNKVRCPNLVAESEAYRYPTAQERNQIGENPVDCDNHALGALRYLISRLDGRLITKLRRQTANEPHSPSPTIPPKETAAAIASTPPTTPKDDDLWTNPNAWNTL